jgi:hypothetical protein
MELIVEREKERNFVLKHLSHHFEKKKKIFSFRKTKGGTSKVTRVHEIESKYPGVHFKNSTSRQLYNVGTASSKFSDPGELARELGGGVQP